jgi:hypothetical protein
MRRLWAASAAVVVSFCLGGLPTVAEEASALPGGSVAVTGSILGMCDVDAGTDATVGGVREWRDWTVTCRESMTDPRVSGLNQHHYNRDCRYSQAPGDTDDVSPIGCVSWSDFMVTGPDGTWVGADRGFVTADGEIDAYRVATGTGAYAGWAYVSHADEGHVSGIIYEGQPPPWPSAPTPAAASPTPPSSPTASGA